MDSPYRSADVDILSSASRNDRRCSPTRATCRRLGTREHRRFAAVRDVGAVFFALFVSAAGLVAIAGGVQGLLMLRAAETKSTVHLAPPGPRIEPVSKGGTSAAVPASAWSAFDVTPLPAGILALTEPVTHDPAVLLSRAGELERSGLPIRITHVRLPPWETPKVAPFQVHATPVSFGGGRTPDAIEIGAVPKFSFFARAGFQQGDVVLTIDGYPAVGTAWTDHVLTDSERGGRAVVELVRDRRRLVLDLTWPPSPGG
jgi:hypothetical protein